MTGMQITVPGSSGAFSGPKVPPPDPVMPPSTTGGALLLLDASHPYAAWPAGTATGGVLPNIATRQATALMSGSVDATLTTAPFASGSAGIIERTPKGGLHVGLSTTCTVPDVGALIVAPDALTSYLKANYTHAYYYSLWEQTTRANTGTGVTISMVCTGASRYGFGVNATGFVAPYNLGYGVTLANGTPASPLEQTGTVKLRAVAAQPMDSDWSTATTFVKHLVTLGNMGNINHGGGNVGKNGSRIIYRAYLEDLTISGRSYATVRNFDQAALLAATSAGGRYYGDTFTAPPA